MNGKMSQELPSAVAFPSMFCILTVIPLAVAGSHFWLEKELFGAVNNPCSRSLSLHSTG